ncbi:FRG domain-containing protein [Herbaspirillum camelliae]|uniref:FRG domain-containing protein n=1 Tax=Herbaspirillum camelliae TaxID=1892903 RepID=UPI000949E15D|nr:FRG domain-containing protein [Herbaspirillum camelliae]
MRIIELERWGEFVEHTIAAHDDGKNAQSNLGLLPPVLYRGHASDEWTLQTTLERSVPALKSVGGYHQAVYDSKHQMESYSGNKWEVPKREDFERKLKRGDWLDGIPALNYLVHLRHHGFPSPLLDWTRSPFVAAYFALSSTTPANGRVAIYCMSSRERSLRLHVSDGTMIRSVGYRVRTHKRHFLQQCEYTICCKNEEGLWSYANHEAVLAADTTSQFDLMKYTLPVTERVPALRYLDQFNLNAYTLFGSEDALVESVARRVLRY